MLGSNQRPLPCEGPQVCSSPSYCVRKLYRFAGFMEFAAAVCPACTRPYWPGCSTVAVTFLLRRTGPGANCLGPAHTSTDGRINVVGLRSNKDAQRGINPKSDSSRISSSRPVLLGSTRVPRPSDLTAPAIPSLSKMATPFLSRSCLSR